LEVPELQHLWCPLIHVVDFSNTVHELRAQLPYCCTATGPDPPWISGLDSSNSSWELVSAGGQPESDPAPTGPVKRVFKTGQDCKEQSVVLALDLSATQAEELLRASTLTQLGDFNFDQLLDLYLDPELKTAFGDSTIRINRAVRAGVSAGHKLRGEVHGVVKSPSLSRYSSTRWYICLRSPLSPSGFVTSCFRTYCSKTCHPKSTKFHPAGVHHSFDTLAEVVAYLAGAKVQWPPELA